MLPIRALATVALALAMFLTACSDAPQSNCAGDTRCTDATSTGDAPLDHVTPIDVPPARQIRSVRIDPPTAALNVSLGATAMQAFHALATYDDGTESAVPGSWGLTDGALGSIDPVSGVFTANGIRGGGVRVQFSTTSAGGGSADAVLTVTLTHSIDTTTSHDAEATFAGAGAPVTDATASATIMYPLDGVMFPQNITAPLVQWQNGAMGDLFRVTYRKDHVSVTQYVAFDSATFQLASALPDDVFSRVAESDPAQSATLQVDRYDSVGHRVISGTPVHLNFAPGSVSGTVYYWQMSTGQLHRIPAGTTADQHLFPSGIVGSADSSPSYSYGGCIACHQISRDGRTLYANGTEAYVFDLGSVDPTGAMVPTRVRPGYRWYFSSPSPDNRRVFATMPDATAQFVDPTTLQPIASATSSITAGSYAHPSWSPDGRTVAIIANVTGWNSNAAFSGGDLALIPVDSMADTVGPTNVISRGTDLTASDPAGGATDCFPTWTPDSRFLVFAHQATSRGTGGDGRVLASLYAIRPPSTAMPTTGTPVRLARAADEGAEPRAHFPNASPFVSGGYYWVVFYSDRYYGNAQAGTYGVRRPQLWVTAISTSFDGHVDPSNVPYWLPGQDVTHENADAVWAAAACRSSGDSCLTSSDCCSGACVPGSDGMYRCQPPPMCRREGETCDRDSDCCGMGTLTCDPVIRTCQKPIG